MTRLGRKELVIELRAPLDAVPDAWRRITT
jgi:hypothetical protein